LALCLGTIDQFPDSCEYLDSNAHTQHHLYLVLLQSEEVQALEDQHGREVMDLQTAASSARARAAAAESAASASAAKVASLTEELAAAEAALTAARQEGEEALAAARAQYEADLQQEQQMLREAKGAVRRQEDEWHHKIVALEVGAACSALRLQHRRPCLGWCSDVSADQQAHRLSTTDAGGPWAHAGGVLAVTACLTPCAETRIESTFL
jgi:hypothetical protein